MRGGNRCQCGVGFCQRLFVFLIYEEHIGQYAAKQWNAERNARLQLRDALSDLCGAVGGLTKMSARPGREDATMHAPNGNSMLLAITNSSQGEVPDFGGVANKKAHIRGRRIGPSGGGRIIEFKCIVEV